MFESIWEDIKSQFRSGNMVIRIVLVNLAIFVGLLFIRLGLNLFVDSNFSGTTYNAYIAPFLELSSDFLTTLTRPWVLFTHMFMHYDLLHFVFNMLFMYWFGKIVGDLIGDRKVLPIYLLSGLASAFLLMFIALLPTPFAIGSSAIGASGGVLGIVMAAAVISPNYDIHLLFFGSVRLKFIALAVIIMQIALLSQEKNVGGAFGHIGGLIMGYVFVRLLHSDRGIDLSVPINRLLDWVKNLFSKNKHPKTKVAYRNPNIRTRQKAQQKPSYSNKNQESSLSHEQKLDAVLEKIKTKGMDSLSDEEKEFLLNASKK